jgi:hypothetical protein
MQEMPMEWAFARLHAQKPPSVQGGGKGTAMTAKPLRRGWSGSIEQRSDPKGRQVKCLTSDEGHVWMPNYDRLPPAVRHRLAESPFNLCAACVDIEAHRVARRRPSLNTYLAVIRAIEEKLRD